MQRSIAGWRSDEQGDWVALLDCGHRQHVRHRPPFFDRPWVEQAAGRAARPGTPLDCPLCTVAVEPGRPQPIPPGVLHGVAPSGAARFYLEFFRVPPAPEPDAEAGPGELRLGAGSAPGLRPS